MKILIVIGDYFNSGNGMSISTQRFVAEFRKMGHEVRVLASDSGGNSEYSVPVRRIPIFSGIIEEQGFHFAKPVQEIIFEAVLWADVVHIEDPFSLSWGAAMKAKDLGKQLTGTFHLYPENMTASVPILDRKLSNEALMRIFRNISFRYCDAIQCPTDKVKARLEEYKFDNALYTISNGITEEFLNNPHNPDPDRFQILSIGRFSNEKDQKTLIAAIKKSKYAEKIHLVMAGKGPLEEEYRELCSELKNPVEMKFCTPEELRAFMSKSQVYVHTATIEIEGMSCMESFASGCVPIIANSELSSTASYALSENNVFCAGNSEELARKIDFWYENRDLLKECSKQYEEYAKGLSVTKSAEKAIRMMQDIIYKYNFK